MAALETRGDVRLLFLREKVTGFCFSRDGELALLANGTGLCAQLDAEELREMARRCLALADELEAADAIAQAAPVMGRC
jgi:hypothetical protein